MCVISELANDHVSRLFGFLSWFAFRLRLVLQLMIGDDFRDDFGWIVCADQLANVLNVTLLVSLDSCSHLF